MNLVIENLETIRRKFQKIYLLENEEIDRLFEKAKLFDENGLQALSMLANDLIAEQEKMIAGWVGRDKKYTQKLKKMIDKKFYFYKEESQKDDGEDILSQIE